MVTKNSFLIGFSIIMIIISFVLLTLLMTTKAFNEVDYKMWTYACNDGCSIATKDIDGFLTNETFQCWIKCKEYIGEQQ